MDYNVHDALRAGFDQIVYVVRREILDDVRDHVRQVFGDELRARFVIQDLDSLPTGFSAPPDRRKPWGTAHAVMCAAEDHDGAFVVCNADDLYGPAAFAQLHDFLTTPGDAEGALIGYPLRDTLGGGGGVARGLCHVGKDAWLEHVIEVSQIRQCDAWFVGLQDEDTPIELTGDEMVSMNLWALTASMVRGIGRQFRGFLQRWGAHPAREFYLSTAVDNHVRTYGARVRALSAKEQWLGVTYEYDRGAFQLALQGRIDSGAYPRRLAYPLPRGG